MSSVGDQLNAPHEQATTSQHQTLSEKREARLHEFIDHRLDECGKCSFSAVLGFFAAIFGCFACSLLLWRNVGAWLWHRNSYTVEFQSISLPSENTFISQIMGNQSGRLCPTSLSTDEDKTVKGYTSLFLKDGIWRRLAPRVTA